MPKLKRASAKLAKTGSDLEVHKCFWGYVLVDPTLTNYETPVYESAEQCIQAAAEGVRPRKHDTTIEYHE